MGIRDSHYNRSCRQLKKEIRNFQNLNFERFITTLSPNNNTIWRPTKRLKGPRIHVPSICKPEGEWAQSDEKQKADVFAQHLNEVFKAEPGEDNNDIMDFISAQCQMSPPIKVFAPLQVKAVISKFNTWKAPGYRCV